MLRISWTAKRSNQSILNELKIKDRSSTIIKRCILGFFGHAIRQDELEKLCCKARLRGLGVKENHIRNTST